MGDAKKQARAEARRAQAKFERRTAQLDDAAKERRESFKRAADAGLSMAEIGEAVGLHRSRVNNILKGK
ncbi:MAG: hypothetical protein QOE75_143 [Solirubrobacterales bacterium]|jgi:hypothetical protein|nr:hypothetical protein [Solirubrobacterales bacterium]